MSNYLISFSPVNATAGRVSFSRSDKVDRKCLAPQWQTQPKPVPQADIHRIISNHITSTRQDIVLAMHSATISAEVRDLLNQAHVLEDFDAQCETVVFSSCLKRGDDHLRSFVIDEEASPITSPILASKDDVNEAEGGRIFLVSPEKTIFLNNYGKNNSPKRNIHNILDGNISGVPLSGLEICSALVYSLEYLKSGPELKLRRPSDSPRHELRAFYSALYALQAMLDLQVNASMLNDKTLSLYSDPRGHALSPVEHIRTLLGTQLMPRMENELNAISKLLTPSDFEYLTREEVERFKVFMETRMVPV